MVGSGKSGCCPWLGATTYPSTEGCPLVVMVVKLRAKRVSPLKGKEVERRSLQAEGGTYKSYSEEG